MGQYYRIAIRKDGEKQISLIRPDGVKMMEHAYIGNFACQAAFKMLLNNPARVAWVGDYTLRHPDNKPAYIKRAELFKNRPEARKFVLAAARQAWERKHEKLVDIDEIGMVEPDEDIVIINHTKQQYINLARYKRLFSYESWGHTWCINPLAILCDASQEFAGGDYCGANISFDGLWSGDVIEVKMASDFIPENEKKRLGMYEERHSMYEELLVAFTDTYQTAELTKFTALK